MNYLVVLTTGNHLITNLHNFFVILPKQKEDSKDLPGEGREDALFAFKMMAEEVHHQRLYQ